MTIAIKGVREPSCVRHFPRPSGSAGAPAERNLGLFAERVALMVAEMLVAAVIPSKQRGSWPLQKSSATPVRP